MAKKKKRIRPLSSTAGSTAPPASAAVVEEPADEDELDAQEEPSTELEYEEPEPDTSAVSIPEADRHAIDAVAQMTAEDNAPESDIHACMLPFALIRDKARMTRYATALGRTPEEAQVRRQHLKLTAGIMELYAEYKAFCEAHGLPKWTERGFAATLVCFQRGIPIEEPEDDAPQDILDDFEKRLQARKEA